MYTYMLSIKVQSTGIVLPCEVSFHICLQLPDSIQLSMQCKIRSKTN